ncbi:tetratricopeptide repeat protein [Coleofasciculus sp. F4-SAH-05]|uniref:tetratricopeptide repeat protein n=1 Tax=Coleofasciculus sp. F4-SAH-05 TaxID=3069525 RepID=UPI0032FBD6B3
MELAGFLDPPFRIRSPYGVGLELDDPEEIIRGFIDTLVVQEQLWILVIESKRTSIPVPAALPQLLAYMLRRISIIPMKPIPANFIDDFPIDLGEEYQPLRRALKRRRGFGLLFVRCSPAQGERLIGKVRKDIPQKTVDVLSLDEPIDNLYEIIDKLPNKDKLDILFIKGLEKSLVDYIKPGIGGEGDYYKEDTVPRILGHLNLQRERFRDDFQICFVFLLPLYALKYFIRRAPDFFDWRSGVWEFPTSSDLIEQEASPSFNNIDAIMLAAPEEKQKAFWSQHYLKIVDVTTPKIFKFLAFFASILTLVNKIIIEILKVYKIIIKIIEILEFYNEFEYFNDWYSRGVNLSDLGRHEEALDSFDKVIEIKPDYHYAWYRRCNALYNLGRYQEVITSFDKFLEIKPDDYSAWNLRGIALSTLGRYEEAIASYDKAIEIKSDDHYAWYHRGIALFLLKRYEEAIASFDKALEFKPDNQDTWFRRGNALYHLGRYEEAIASYDKAIEIKHDNQDTWSHRGNALSHLGRYEEAIASYDKAIEIKSDDHYAWSLRGIALSNLGRYVEYRATRSH